MKRLLPLLILAALAFVIWSIYCSARGRPIVGLKGYSTWSTNPLPAAPTPSSGVMGMRTY